MDQRNDHSAEIEESRKALEQAKASSAEADHLMDEVHRTSLGIRVIVDRNGYVDRFRKILRGA